MELYKVILGIEAIIASYIAIKAIMWLVKN